MHKNTCEQPSIIGDVALEGARDTAWKKRKYTEKKVRKKEDEEEEECECVRVREREMWRDVADEKEMRKTGSRALRDKREERI